MTGGGHFMTNEREYRTTSKCTDLAVLRGENRKTTFVSCAILAVIFAVLYWYTGHGFGSA
eukprot:m.35133 g.35133  ORF g.35133 m.35133 type:complete len:60 (+) comp32066_c1_seq2:344-523(+)